MKHSKFKLWSILLSLILLFTGGCSKPVEETQGNTEEKLLVYTSFYPMYDFAKNVGKDKIDLKLMIPPGVEAHDWEPTAKIMGEMEKADVLIYNGLEMEPWIENLTASIQSDQLIVVEASQGTALIEGEAHEDEQEAEEQHGKYDPHVWLNPMNAIKQAENIKDAFIQADEVNKDFYEANFKEYVDRLNGLDEKYKQELSNAKRKEIVVAHAAFSYLTNRYGLEQVAITGLSPQEEPSAAKLAELTVFAREHNLKYIFFETLTSPRLAQVLANEVGADIAVLNPLEGLTQEEIDAGKDYIAVMEENLAALKKALGE